MPSFSPVEDIGMAVLGSEPSTASTGVLGPQWLPSFFVSNLLSLSQGGTDRLPLSLGENFSLGSAPCSDRRTLELGA